MALNKIGSLTGNSIQLATNMNADGRRQGSINPNTYLILIGLSCAGLPLALTLSKAKDLIRKEEQHTITEASVSEGSPLLGNARNSDNAKPFPSLNEALRDLWTTMRMKHILILLPVYITGRWSNTYQGMYLTEYFTVRGRVLAGFVSTVLGILATLIWGFLLDGNNTNPSGKISPRTSRRWLVCNLAWWSILAVSTIQWVLNFAMQTQMQTPGNKVVLDISDPGYAKAIAAYCLYR
jgi:hypothetical protein